MSETIGLIRDGEGRPSCAWHGAIPEYTAYHDAEWGRPVASDQRYFEKLSLEGFQAGLSWLTVLRKRDAFRRAFVGFDIGAVARFGESDVKRLLGDAGIIRHRGKIESVINNARRAPALIQEVGSLAAYFWRFEPEPSARPPRIDWPTLMAMPKTAESKAMSADLKRRGWSFVGPTTIYAFMQSMGIVNDHIEGCWCRAECESLRAGFGRPPRRL